jgi:cysteine-rich repeat protein
MPAPYCGDKAVDGAFGEVCDDGVNNGQPGSCSVDCKNAVGLPSCGDAKVQPPEQCDDGSSKNGGPQSTCDMRCRFKCGNGQRDPGEQCDNGVNDGSYGTCRPDCTLAGYCGDGVQSAPEQCDKGTANVPPSTAYGQGLCTTLCGWAGFCGDGRVQTMFGEQCDGTPGCGADCTPIIVH